TVGLSGIPSRYPLHSKVNTVVQERVIEARHISLAKAYYRAIWPPIGIGQQRSFFAASWEVGITGLRPECPGWRRNRQHESQQHCESNCPSDGLRSAELECDERLFDELE